MADDPSPDNAAEPVRPAPSVPKPPRDPVVIDGVATDLTEEAATPPQAAASEAEPVAAEPPEPEPAPPPPPPPPAPARSASAFAYGASGAVLGAVLALGAAWIFDPRAAPLDALSTRQDAVEKADADARKAIEARLAALELGQASLAKAAALDSLDQRVAKLERATGKPDAQVANEAALDKRLTKLEAAVVTPEALAAAATDARAARETAAKALAAASAAGAGKTSPAPTSTPGSAADARIEKLVAEANALSDRVAKMEAAASNPPTPDPRVGQLVADAAALSDRVAKLETVQAAAKAETRIPASEPTPKDEGAARAVAAIALAQRMRAGEPFPAEWAALSRAGADAGKLAALKPYADSGAPSPSSLAAAFAAVAPAILAAAHPQSGAGGPWDQLLDHVSGLVKVHRVAEAAGDDPDALVSQVEGALARGQVGAALAAYQRLPEACRKAAGDWADKARALLDADAAARALGDAGIANLAAAKN